MYIAREVKAQGASHLYDIQVDGLNHDAVLVRLVQCIQPYRAH